VDALWVPCLWVFISSIRATVYPAPEQLGYVKGHPYPIILTVLLILGAIILYARRFDLLVFIKKNKLVFILYFWMGLSIFWSSFPWISFKRWIKTIGSLEMVLIMVTAPDALKAFSSVIRRYFYLVIPSSIILILFFPSLGLRAYPDGQINWVGLFVNKNVLAQPAMIFSLFFAWRLTQRGQEKTVMLDYIPLLLSMYVLFGSRSITSLFGFFLGLGALLIMWFGNVRRRYTGVILPYVFVLTVAIYFLLQNIIWKHPIMTQVIEYFGKDTTFTGRTRIWSELWQIALMRPFLGHGFGGFWVGELNPLLKRFWSELGFHALTAHSGYLYVFLDIGIIGVIIVLLLILSTYMKISRSFAVHFELARLRMAILLTVLLHNVTEVSLCNLNDPLWVWFLFSAVSLPLLSMSEETPLSYSPCRGFPFFRKRYQVFAKHS